MRHAGISRQTPDPPKTTSAQLTPRRLPGAGRAGRTAVGPHGDKARWYGAVAISADGLGVFLPVLVGYGAAGYALPSATAVAATAMWLAIRAAHRRYTRRSLGENRGLLATAHDWALLLGSLAVLRVVTGEDSPVAGALAALAPALVVTGATGALLHRHLTAQRRQAHAVQRVLLAGEPRLVETVAGQLAAGTDHAYVVVGAVPVGGGVLTSGIPEAGRLVPGTGPAADDGAVLLSAARRLGADHLLVVPGSQLTGDRLRRLCWSVQDAGLPLAVTTGLRDLAPHRVELSSAAGLHLLHVAPPVRRGPALLLKTVLDRTAAAAGLLLLLPLFLTVAVAIRLDSSGPALYRQRRVGLRGTPFTMWKFRTMVCGADTLRGELEAANEHQGPLFKIRRDPRITRVGRLLRRTSLDELPQLVNVLAGQMSLVGPRPPLPAEAARYTATERRRLLVKPGMTGPWQVSGRSDLTWDEGVALDVCYADNWSFTQDLDVLARTVRAVAGGRGAY